MDFEFLISEISIVNLEHKLQKTNFQAVSSFPPVF
jgi:hypothetical protein